VLWARRVDRMGLRFRKSFPFGWLIRLNLSKSGVSVGLGPPGLNVNIGPRGVRQNVGIPGRESTTRSQRAGGTLVIPRRNPTTPRGHGLGVVLVLVVIGVITVAALNGGKPRTRATAESATSGKAGAVQVPPEQLRLNNRRRPLIGR
jgi:hypothetical protein